jgi:hypothetical protein
MFSSLMTNLSISNVPVTLGNDVRLRSNEANVRLGGELHLVTSTAQSTRTLASTGQLVPRLALEGSLKTVGGTYNLKFEPENVKIKQNVESLADSLCKEFHLNATPDWQWFEPVLTYSLGMLPRSLFMAYLVTGKQEYLDVAVKSLEFLTSVVIVDRMLHPIGCNGWYIKGDERAWWDQQPVDPLGHTLSYLAAYDATQDHKYLDLAKTSFDWFFGHNSVGESLYDPVTGGCYDALTNEGPNYNQGSESTIACLLAQLSMQPYLEKL